MKPNIITRFLPVECYAPASRDYKPRSLSVDGIVQHYFSGRNAFPDDRYNLEKCWQLMHDLNFKPEDRKYDLYHGKKKLWASAHFMIGRKGEIWNLVPIHFQAYHAGVSEWHGRKNCNEFMAGTENIGELGVDYTDEQYESNSQLSAWLMDMRLFEIDMIAGHEDVSPGRKTDPGETFDWDRLREMILEKTHRENKHG